MATAIEAFSSSGVFPSGIGGGAPSDYDDVSLLSSISTLKSTDNGSEALFKVCNHFYNVIQDWQGGALNVTSSLNSQLQGNSSLTRTYSFTFNLDLSDDAVGGLDVQAETA